MCAVHVHAPPNVESALSRNEVRAASLSLLDLCPFLVYFGCFCTIQNKDTCCYFLHQ